MPQINLSPSQCCGFRKELSISARPVCAETFHDNEGSHIRARG